MYSVALSGQPLALGGWSFHFHLNSKPRKKDYKPRRGVVNKQKEPLLIRIWIYVAWPYNQAAWGMSW